MRNSLFRNLLPLWESMAGSSRKVILAIAVLGLGLSSILWVIGLTKTGTCEWACAATMFATSLLLIWCSTVPTLRALPARSEDQSWRICSSRLSLPSTDLCHEYPVIAAARVDLLAALRNCRRWLVSLGLLYVGLAICILLLQTDEHLLWAVVLLGAGIGLLWASYGLPSEDGAARTFFAAEIVLMANFGSLSYSIRSNHVHMAIAYAVGLLACATVLRLTLLMSRFARTARQILDQEPQR